MAKKKEEPSLITNSTAIMSDVTKSMGGDIVVSARDAYKPKRIPTGVLALDMSLMGGWPEGMMSQIIGPPSSGKTTLSLHSIRSAQEKYPNKHAVFIDQEHTFDPNWAESQGVDLDRLIYVESNSGEQAVDIAEAFLRAEDVSLVVLDSIAATLPVKMINNSAEDQTVGLQAKLVGGLCAKAVTAMSIARKAGHVTTFLVLNQWRCKIVLMGDNREPAGGKALGFYCSVIMELKASKAEYGDDKDEVEGVETTSHYYMTRKNKTGQGPQTGEFSLYHQQDGRLPPGEIDQSETVLAYCKLFDMFDGGGTRWSLTHPSTGEVLTFGKKSEASLYLDQNLDLRKELQYHIIDRYRKSRGLNDEWY